MLRSLFILFQLFILASCGVESGPIAKDYGLYTESSYGAPLLTTHSKIKCDPQKSEITSIEMFLDGTFSSLTTEKIKSTIIVKGFSLGGESQQTLNGRRMRKRKIKSSRLYNMCNPKEAYEEGTFENAAFGVGVVLNNFESSYEKILKEISLPKVKVNILPHIYQKNQKTLRKGYLTNNAYYHHQRDEITFLPQGKNLKYGTIPFNGVPLWKIPMVSLHEYGHHIFEYAFFHKNKFVKRSGDPRLSLCIDNSSPSHSHFSTSKKGDRRKEINHRNISFKVLNEAFADLVAFYGSKGEMSMKGVGCMERSRNVGSSVFFNNDKKELDKDVMEVFLDTKKREILPCNIGTNYQDEHLIGAIYAHSFAKILKQVRFSDKTSLRFLIQWVLSLKKTNPKSYSVEQYLNFIPKNFFKKLDETTDVSREVCEDFFKAFPQTNFTCL